MQKEFSQIIKDNKSVHIFYYITEQQSYLNNLISYIRSGIEQDDHILIIESEKIILQLNRQLKGILTKQQMSHVHTINNFDYYCSNGSFQPHVIFSYLNNILKPFYDNGLSFRTWAHVEWHDEQESILAILEEFEKEADRLVNEGGLYLVCAYDSERVPESLKTALMSCHEYIIKGNKIYPSDMSPLQDIR
ncbi:MEDS domain-containing protein [Bacillus sp. MUM 13]|uniref:MEDS domain-containing protein n=1 Tax=Bacillus sp. MUM 13 TaxID=1678001 RepID=UPI0008F5ABBA|nr:MEDS domain-containing protein [Bacillus sp. MUM 13]OIK10305.1 3-ketoacyl-ACP reductase [Bacillus sp. MUM 13]